MATRLFQIDAFTTQRFRGNPAAVMPLDRFPEDAVLQAIAAENNLAETAFIVREGEDYRLRWFTPTVEVPLCGHATLASGAAVLERLEPQRQRVVFHSASGPLAVTRNGARYVMDFPARPSQPITPPPGLREALGSAFVEVSDDSFNYLVLLESAQAVRALKPDLAAVAGLACNILIVTGPGSGDHDFTSRCFAPAIGVAEDPVTGSAHCTLAPYWARRLGKTAFRAFQASARGGEVWCRLIGDRVELEGDCVFYLDGIAEF